MTAESRARLSVVLVNYDTTDLAEGCLRSMREHLDIDTVEVILVDNASRAFDAGRLAAAWPGLKVIESATNLGFGQGNNLGARHASGEYLWLLNTDTLIPEDHRIGALLGFLDEHREYAAAAPLLTDLDGVVQPWQTGYFPALWRMVLSPPARAVARIAPALAGLLSRVRTDLWPVEDADVEQVAAAAVVVRRTAFEAVGGFSPEYFFFLEDTDLCRKLHDRGWRIRWMPQSRVIHLWGRSVADPIERHRLFLTAQEVYFRSWHSPVQLWTLRIIRLPRYAAVRCRYRWRGAGGGCRP
jgi:GT2 family glycosyltransferase